MNSSNTPATQCLDLLQVNWVPNEKGAHPQEMCDQAILVEVWPSGGLLQATVAIKTGSRLHLAVGKREISATAVACSKDQYGYNVEFTLARCGGWFPAAYRPAFVLPSNEELTRRSKTGPAQVRPVRARRNLRARVAAPPKAKAAAHRK